MISFQKPTIPTREEFHRFYAGEINVRDFCTERTNQRRIPPYTVEEHREKSNKAQMQETNKS